MTTRSHPTGGHGRPLVTIATGDATNRPLKTSETVARDVVHAIVTGGLRTGDKLPSEAAMLEEYGVSRESLREGLRLLEVQGLITLRRGPGGGPVVGRIDAANLGRMGTLYFHLAGCTYDELFDATIMTESTLAGLAARNPDRAAVRAAMQPYVDADEPTATDVEAFVEEHSRFHAVLASLASNQVLGLLLQSVGQVFTHHIVLNSDPREQRAVIEQDHIEIARAVAGGYGAKAATLMEQHTRFLVDAYRAEMADRMGELIEWR
jgi:GntR family transcriptional repressor for pyruvate dehydrogenase complex